MNSKRPPFWPPPPELRFPSDELRTKEEENLNFLGMYKKRIVVACGFSSSFLGADSLFDTAETQGFYQFLDEILVGDLNGGGLGGDGGGGGDNTIPLLRLEAQEGADKRQETFAQGSLWYPSLVRV